jgi:hypothetical protein
MNASIALLNRAMTKDSDRSQVFLVWKLILCSLALLLMTSIPIQAQNASPDAQEENPARHLVTNGLVIKKPYRPISTRQRIQWELKGTLGPESLFAGVLSAGMGTALNRPSEDGPSWGGFGQRYGVRLTGVAIGNGIEAGLGAIWGEDPRYDRLPGQPFASRVRNAIKLTFTARYSDGHLRPAYARFVADAGNNVLSDMWRPKSETDPADTLLRMVSGILGRMGANTFIEFWPDVRKHVLHRATEEE